MRKLLIIALLLAIIAAGAIFFIRFRKTPAAPITTTDSPVAPLEPTPIEVATSTLASDTPLLETTPIETTPQYGLRAATSESIVDYWINQFDGQAYYITTDGIIRRAGFESNPTSITSSHFDGGVARVISAPRGDAVIMSSGNRQAQEFKVYDLERNVWRALPAGTTAAAWSPVSPTNEIVFLQTPAPTSQNTAPVSSLNIYTVSKGTSRKIIDLPQYDLELAWVTPNTVMLSAPPAREYPGTLWSLDLQHKTMKVVLRDQLGLWVRWWVAGGIAFDTAHGNYLLDSQGAVEATLPFLTTPQKCAREAFDLYCAVPYAGLTARQLPDDYLQGAAQSSDNIVVTSLITLPQIGEQTTLLDAEKENTRLDVWHLSAYSGVLYFINRYDHRLYAFRPDTAR